MMVPATLLLLSANVLALWSRQLTSGEARGIYVKRVASIEPHLRDVGDDVPVPDQHIQTAISFVQGGSDDDDEEDETAGSESGEKEEDKHEEKEIKESKNEEDQRAVKESQAEAPKGHHGSKKHGKKRKSHHSGEEHKQAKITEKHPSSLTTPQEQSDYLRTSMQKAASATYKASLKLVKMLDHLNGAVSLANAIVKVPTGEPSFAERVTVSAAGQKISLQGLLQEATKAKETLDKLFTILLAAKHSIIGDVNAAIVGMSPQGASHK